MSFMLEAVHRDRSWNAAYACASCAAAVCASLAPLASGSAAGTLTLTMQVVIADDIRACPPGTPAEATGCFSRKGAADVRGLGGPLLERAGLARTRHVERHRRRAGV